MAEIYSGLRFWWLRTDDSLWKSRGGAWSTDNHLSKQTRVASTTGHTTQYMMHRCNATAYAFSLMDQLSGAKHKTRMTPLIAIRSDWKMSFVMIEAVSRILLPWHFKLLISILLQFWRYRSDDAIKDCNELNLRKYLKNYSTVQRAAKKSPLIIIKIFVRNVYLVDL